MKPKLKVVPIIDRSCQRVVVGTLREAWRRESHRQGGERSHFVIVMGLTRDGGSWSQYAGQASMVQKLGLMELVRKRFTDEIESE